ncbi:MAG: hypothetical protein ACP5DX_14390 [Paracoccaceae bacterium]
MAVYEVKFYDIDPSALVPIWTGGSFVWSGPATAEGAATITDNESGIEGLTLDDDSWGAETATADVTLGGGDLDGFLRRCRGGLDGAGQRHRRDL